MKKKELAPRVITHSSGIRDLPTQIKIFSVFLDVLFGVLMTFFIVEIPVKEAFHLNTTLIVPLTIIAQFCLLYFTLMIKLLFHWWGLRADLAISSSFLSKEAKLSDYIGALIVGIWYFVLAKLLLTWFTSTDLFILPLKVFFIVVAIIRTADALVNQFTVSALLKDESKRQDTKPAIRRILNWYKVELPRCFIAYYFHIANAIFAWFSNLEYLWLCIGIFLLLELLPEFIVWKGRRNLYAELEHIRNQEDTLPENKEIED